MVNLCERSEDRVECVMGQTATPENEMAEPVLTPHQSPFARATLIEDPLMKQRCGQLVRQSSIRTTPGRVAQDVEKGNGLYG